jgi:hypothetical protein
MKKLFVVSFMLWFLTLSSDHKVIIKPTKSRREVLLHLYKKKIDSLYYKFGIERNFYLLDKNCNVLNSYLWGQPNSIENDLMHLREDSKRFILYDSIRRDYVPNLKNLKIDEGYQFKYNESFCMDDNIFTIIKSEDKYKLHTAIFRYVQNCDTCWPEEIIVRNSWANINEVDWLDLVQSLDYADYWSLNYDDFTGAFDPSHLTVCGVKNIINKDIGIKQETNSVHRICFRNKPIYKSFIKIIKLAGIKKVCKFGKVE